MKREQVMLQAVVSTSTTKGLLYPSYLPYIIRTCQLSTWYIVPMGWMLFLCYELLSVCNYDSFYKVIPNN